MILHFFCFCSSPTRSGQKFLCYFFQKVTKKKHFLLIGTFNDDKMNMKGSGFMARAKNYDITRVNVNLPKSLVEKVKEYAKELKIPITYVYTILLDRGIEHTNMIKGMPNLISALNDVTQLMDKEKNAK